MHDRCRVLADRFAFPAPETYRRMEAAGCFEPRHPAHVQLTDLVWMGAAALAYLVPLAAGLEPRGVPARGVPEHGAPEKDA